MKGPVLVSFAIVLASTDEEFWSRGLLQGVTRAPGAISQRVWSSKAQTHRLKLGHQVAMQSAGILCHVTCHAA